MANISFQLNTTTGFTDAVSAIANWGTGNVITAWADAAGADVANGEIVYQDESAGTLSNPFAGGGSFYAFESSDSTITAVQIDDSGVVSSLTTTTTSTTSTTTTSTTTTSTTTTSTTTTTTTEAPPTYTISASAPIVNEGDVITITADASLAGNTVGWTISGGVNSDDFSAGWSGTTGTFDFTTAQQATFQLTVSNDVSFGEGAETITITLDAQDSAGNTAGDSVSVTINDTSVNLAPTVVDVNATVTQNSTGTDLVTIDLSSSTSDPEADTISWIITAVPQNGDLFDLTLPNTPLTSAVLPYTLDVASAGQVIYKPGTTFGSTGQVTAGFQWKANDGNQDSTSANATIVVNPPANQPPASINVQNSLISSTAGNSLIFQRAATDEDATSLTFEWCTDDGTVLDISGLNLQHGTLTAQSGITEGFSYTNTTVVNPGSSSVEEIFYFKAIDSDGLEDIGQVRITLTAEENTAPYFQTNPPVQPISVNENSIWVTSTPIAATDNEGHDITISVQSYTPTTGVTTCEVENGILRFEADDPGTYTVVIRATDQWGAFNSANDITYTFNVLETPYRQVSISQWTNSSDSACDLTRTNDTPIFYATNGGTTFLSNLPVGTSLYTNNNLSAGSVYASTDVSSTWLSVEEVIGGNASVKAIKINSSGVIVEIVNCEVTGGSAWPIDVQWNANGGNEYCSGQYESGEAWQNISETASLADVVAAGGGLFASEYWANAYAGQSPVGVPSGLLLSTGVYSAPNIDGYYSISDWASGWQQNSEGSYLQECEPQVQYETQTIDVKWLHTDPANISAVCYATNEDLSVIPIFYRAPIGITYNLIELARAQMPIWTTRTGADFLDYSQLQPSSVLIDIAPQGASRGFVIWDNENYSGYRADMPAASQATWYAFFNDGHGIGETDNILEIARGPQFDAQGAQTRPASNYGFCSGGFTTANSVSYQRPNIVNLNLDFNQAEGSRKNVYYGFYGCEPILDPGINGGLPYFPFYIVDGMHTESNNDPDASYIKSFIREISIVPNTNTEVRSTVKTPTTCMTYWSKIRATNLEEAQDMISQELSELAYDLQFVPNIGDNPTLNVRPVSVNPVDLGLGSEARIEYAMFLDDSALAGTCGSCNAGNLDTEISVANGIYVFPTIDEAEILERHTPNFDLEKNYILDNVSKPLLRTNPKLSTNAKLVANKDGQIFIESINAAKELASIQYKKFELSSNGSWSKDLARFYKQNNTPSDLIYTTKTSFSDFTVHESYDKQIEEDYHYGTTYNYSKLHDEDLRIMAPIWLDKDIPNKFVIFRVSNPVGELDFDENSNLGNIRDILKHSEIVETFDLTSKSKLGKYIRNHVNSESFPKTPIEFNFDKNEKSNFRGIDLDKGGFVSKGEYLYEDFVRTDNPLIASNKLITDGFERNKLACANLINLEFLFDDNRAGDYSINRYFGLYVNDVDSGYGSLQSADEGQLVFKTLNSYINDSSESAIPSFKHIKNTPTLGYVSVGDDYYKISTTKTYEPKNLNVYVNDSHNRIPEQIKLAPNGSSIDLTRNEDAGFDFVKVKVVDTPANNDRFFIFESRESAYSIKFLRFWPNENWTFKFTQNQIERSIDFMLGSSVEIAFNNLKAAVAAKIADPNTDPAFVVDLQNLNIDYDSNLETIFVTEICASLDDLKVNFTTPQSDYATILKTSRIQNAADFASSKFFATSTLPAGTSSNGVFSKQGSNVDIAKAIADCINNSTGGFTATYDKGNDFLYIKSNIKGYRRLQSGVLVPDGNVYDFLEIENRDIATTEECTSSLLKLSHGVSDSNSVYYMSGGNSAGRSVLVSKDSEKSINVGDYLPTKSVGVFNKVIDIVEDVARNNSNYKKVILEKVYDLESGEQPVYADNAARIGLFSCYDIHDLDVDFYDESNSDLKELQYETATTINYEPNVNSTSNLTVFGNDYDDTPAEYFTGISDILPEETLDTYQEAKLYSEFDRLQENNLKEFATLSRVVPNINKWVLKDVMTVREQPYYLNANEAFGRTNFAPDFSALDRDRLSMTHEWFYLDNLPKYLTYEKLNNTFSYVNFAEGFDITPDLFKSTAYDYFDRFMISDGFEVKDSNGIKSFIKTNLQKKYTLVDGGNSSKFASTIFKGIKVSFKKRKELTNTLSNEFFKSPEFNGYKFSTLVSVKAGHRDSDISYEVIQNKKFKFVIFLITVSLNDLWIDGSLNRKLLYELNHSVLWNHETENFVYSDVELNGAMNLNDVNWSDPTQPDYLVVRGITASNGTVSQYFDQINPDDDNNFGDIHVTLNLNTGPYVVKLKPKSIDSQDQITLLESPTDIGGNPVNLDNLPGYTQTSARYSYKEGGKNAFQSILDSLAVSNIANMLTMNSSEVKYTTVEATGELTQNQFKIDFEDGAEIIKEASLLTTADQDKPKTFKLFNGTIGFNLFDGDIYYPFLIRHNGDYTVSTKPVVTFTDTYTHFKTNTLQPTINSTELGFEEDMYKHSLTDIKEVNLAKDYYRRYNRCGTAFNLGFIQDGGTHDANWGVIKNHFYRKVNEINTSGVTKLSTTTDKLPLYPLIGEVAIDKKDVNVFKSSWDKNYYTRSLAGGLTEAVPGTFETKEEKSYLGSTIMKVKDSYSLTRFTSEYVRTQEEQDEILINQNNGADVVIFEDDDNVYLDFYLTSTIKNLLSEDGILSSIRQFVKAQNSAGDKTTLADDAELYIDDNLLNIFNVSNIELYSSRIKGEDSSVQSVASESEATVGGFERDKNFSFQQHEQQPLNFRLIYNKRLGYSYRIRPVIKIKS